MTKATLFDYYRSSASYRVRIALNLKKVRYESVQVNLAQGAQKEAEYRARNPQGFVPMLEMDGHRITQSLAIIDYLDAKFPQPELVPRDAADRAHVLALGLLVACDIHPLNTLRVLKYLTGPLGQQEDVRDEWYRHWVLEGFSALEAMAAPRAGRFLFGDQPGLADICLVPQVYNARVRAGLTLDEFPLISRVDAEAANLHAFAAAHPNRLVPRT